jgi:predicted ATPase/class 3 adenylate cyclase
VTELPTGTVTLLFTDMEGSTRLLERLGDRYVELLYEHRRLLRAAVARFNGREVGMEGDASFVAFTSARGAVAAAVAGQQALATHAWPDGVRPQVRIGIHTGEPLVVAQDYAGLDVHRAARICAAAHGGQVLVSRRTRELLGDDLPPGVGLHDLGEHRLKDLTHPERLFQLLISGLPADFPPPRTLGGRATNLPTQLTRFVGRQRELAEARTLLERPEVRLLTLTGPGGTGKTRLAVQVAGELAEAFPDGVAFVGLAQVNDPGLVVPTIAQALEIKESAARPLLDSLIQHVDDRRLLLILDNFEQVLAAAPLVVGLLRACLQLKTLVTSRAALHVSGEHAYPVPTLSLPKATSANALGDLTSSEAATLFIERAQAVNPSFAVTEANAPVLAEICRRLDGLPLAIELAAARSRMLSPQALLSRLERRLQLLKGGDRDLPARQQTLRATIDWSYDLLEVSEQSLFARLAVFAGGCTMEAAEVVCDLEGDLDVLAGLDALADKNLVQPREALDGDPRLLMLDTVREYALERLAGRSEADTVARRHADYYLGLAEQAESELSGSWQGAWYERLEADLPNFRAALTSSLAHRPDTTASLAAALMPLWVSRGHITQGVRWLDAALEHRGSISPSALGKALFVKSYLLLQVGAHHGQAERLLEESLSLFRMVGDTTWTVRAVSVLGQTAIRAREFDRGLALREQAVALARGQEDKWNLAMAVCNLGLSLLQAGDHGRARAALDEALLLNQSFGDLESSALVLDGLGMLALAEGDSRRASSLVEQALVLARKVGHVLDAADFLADLGLVALHEDDYGRAAVLFEESLRLALPMEDELSIAKCLWGLAALAAAHGQPVRGVRLWAAATALRYELTAPPSAVGPLEERLLSPARERLGLDAFDAEWSRGQAMGREDVIAYALGRD